MFTVTDVLSTVRVEAVPLSVGVLVASHAPLAGEVTVGCGGATAGATVNVLGELVPTFPN